METLRIGKCPDGEIRLTRGKAFSCLDWKPNGGDWKTYRMGTLGEMGNAYISFPRWLRKRGVR